MVFITIRIVSYWIFFDELFQMLVDDELVLLVKVFTINRFTFPGVIKKKLMSFFQFVY